MSKIRIRVGSEDIQLNAPRDEPFPVDLVEREIAQSRLRQTGSVTLTLVAGKFVERKPRATVEAIHWSGSNWGQVMDWLSSRVDSAKLHPDRTDTILAWDDDDKFLCEAPGWFLQGKSGDVVYWSDEKFQRLYEPAPSTPRLTAEDADPGNARIAKKSTIDLVRSAIEEYARYAEGNPHGGHAEVAEAAAFRAAEQIDAGHLKQRLSIGSIGTWCSAAEHGATCVPPCPAAPSGAPVMSDVVDQPPPTPRPDLIPVWEHVISDFKLRFDGYETMGGGDPLYVVEHALNDMRERDRVGRERYGTPLTANNGRDHLVDAYQELLDGSVYLKAEWLEGNHQVRRAYHRTLDAILELRVMLDGRAKKNLEDKVGP